MNLRFPSYHPVIPKLISAGRNLLMNPAAGETGTIIQLTVFDGIRDMLMINPIFLIGFAVLALSLILIYKKDGSIAKIKTAVLSFIFFYYLCITLSHVVGIPTIGEFIRLINLKIPLFNPNINIMLLEDGFSLNFIMNILLFVPFGLLCPLISTSFRRIGRTLLAGFGFSFIIEASQLFTLYRISDINDLIANTAGAFIGYMIFTLFTKLHLAKPYAVRRLSEKDYTVYIIAAAVICAFVLGFFCDFGFIPCA